MAAVKKSRATGDQERAPGDRLREVKISEARAGLADIVREAHLLDEPTVITQNGKPAAVVINVDEYREFVAARDARLAERIRARVGSTVWIDADQVAAEFLDVDHGGKPSTP